MNTVSHVGSMLLALTVPTALFSTLFYFIGNKHRQENYIIAARRANHMVFALITMASLLVIAAFLNGDYSIMYVYSYSSRSLPLFFKVTGLWAGLDGSLLLWTWLVALYSFIALKQNQSRNADWMPIINACMMVVVIFFVGLMLFSNNPFTPVPGGSVPDDGRGLNPLLQNIAMVVHPPMLYLGFTGFAVPFSFVMAALYTRRLDATWIEHTRRWTIIAWFFLSIGLILGGAWAYVELGWGGFWAWDPVENAGLLPWLLATAYIHSVLIQKKRGMLKVWNVTLVILTFMLTIFGTYLTRSGVVQSVHAFGENKELGLMFLAFLALIATVSFYLVVTRLKDLKSDNTLQSIFSKESAFLFNNVALLVCALTVLWGTMFPTLSELVTGDRITVGQPFFNRIMAPVALVLIFLMGVGPMISWKNTTTRNLRNNVLGPLVVGIIGAVVIFLAGITQWYVVGSMGLAAFVLATISLEFIRGVRVTKIQKKLSTLSAAFDLLAYSNRRFGGYIVHLGILFIFVGIAGTVYKAEADFTLEPGGKYDFHGYAFNYESFDVQEDEHHTSMTAFVSLTEDGKELRKLKPARNYYFSSEQPTTEVDIFQTPLKDVYLIIGNMDDKSGRADFKVTINPFISFMWMGGIVLLMGVVLVLMPRGFKRSKSTIISKTIGIVLALSFAATTFYSAPVLAQGMTASQHEVSSEPPFNPPEGDKRQMHLKEVANKLICQCGGCVREAVGNCTCGFAAKERKRILAMMDAGQSDDAIIAGFIKQYGLYVLAQPPEEGFFNIGYWAPGIILFVGLVTGVVVVTRWRRRPVAAVPQDAVASNAADDAAAKQLIRDLEDF